MRRSVNLLVLSLIALALSGCASLWSGTSRSYSVSPSGLPWGEELVRRALVLESFDQALERTMKGRDGAPDDDVLRALFRGQVAFYAGQWEESGAAFAEADRLTDARYTKSASRSALSLLTNDHALRYVPTRTEQLFSRYYAMLGRVQSGDVHGAAVEARRLSALLEASAVDLDPTERSTHAALRDVAGAVFESAGEWNDAGVAYRNAALLRGTSRDSVDSIHVTRPAGDSATLLLVVESGFVAHYVPQRFAIPMDVTDGTSGSTRSSRGKGSVGTSLSPETLGRVLGLPRHVTAEAALGGAQNLPREPVQAVIDPGPMSAPPVYVVSPLDTGAREAPSRTTQWITALDALPDGGVFLTPQGEGALGGAVGESGRVESIAADWLPHRPAGTRYLGERRGVQRWMEIAWPTLVRPRLPSAAMTLRLEGAAPTPSGVSGESQATHGLRESSDGTTPAGGWAHTLAIPAFGAHTADISDAVGADARRGRLARLARLTARTVTRAVAVEAVREKHGEAAGLLTSVLSSALERADTRAWHLLPGRVMLVRVTVPAGRIEPALLLGGAANPATRALSAVEAAPGTVHVLSTRVWRDPAGSGAPTMAVNERRTERNP